jgi:hypothetical protein
MPDGGGSALPDLPLVDEDLPEANSTLVTDFKTGHCPPRAPLPLLSSRLYGASHPQEEVFPPFFGEFALRGDPPRQDSVPYGPRGGQKKGEALPSTTP